jgi:hypothetical protein
MDKLYEDDILAWSERQGALLRRIACGEQVNDLDLDWDHVAEEIESVGRSQHQAVESLLTQALLHRLKFEGWPSSSVVPGWQAEARLFRRQARKRFTESMRQYIDIADLYNDALAGLPDVIDGQPPQPVPTICPVTLDELLAAD